MISVTLSVEHNVILRRLSCMPCTNQMLKFKFECLLEKKLFLIFKNKYIVYIQVMLYVKNIYYKTIRNIKYLEIKSIRKFLQRMWNNLT